MKKIVYGVGIVLIVVIGVAVYYLDAVIRLGAGYSSKYLCSQVFLAGRDPDVVFENDVKPTNPLFTIIKNSTDTNNRTVTSTGFGFWNPATSVYRAGLGCTVAIDIDRKELLDQAKGLIPQGIANENAKWPLGEQVDLSTSLEGIDRLRLNKIIDDAFIEPSETSHRNTQAVVIVHKGEIIAEKYDPQFTPSTPMLGWSMSKSVTVALVGILVKQKKLKIDDPAPIEAWQKGDDPRAKITIDHLMRMTSGLQFDEIYQPLKDVVFMLYDTHSMAEYAYSKPLEADPGTKWYYSSGTSNILARIIRDVTGGTLVSFNNFLRKNLFEKLHAHSAIIEVDASGSFVGSSYMYATARDWARIGLFFLNDGVAFGEQILPEGWMKYITTPTPESDQGSYGAHVWLNAGEPGNPKNRYYPTLPTELYYLSGHNGQVVAIIPSKELIIVRLGATQDGSWDVEAFIREVLSTVES